MQRSLKIVSRPAVAVTAGILLALIGSARSTLAATYTVDTTVDNAGLTACTAAPNDCSLRGAIIAANTNAGDDTISVPAGVYQLTIAGAGDGAGDLDISDTTGKTTLTGAGAGSTFIQAGTQGPPTPDGIDRVLDVLADAEVEVSGVTIRYGSVTGAGNSGGGVRNQGDLTITDSTVTQNDARDNGGGVSNLATVTLVRVLMSDNTCVVGGGGFYARGETTSSTIVDSTIRDNECSQRGGGVELDGRFTNPPATITGSTISGNRTLSGSGGGGMFLLNNASLTMANSTISGNEAIDRAGGGIRAQDSAITLINTTISGNTSGNSVSGGIHLTNSATAGLRNTIIADNLAGADCVVVSGATITSDGNNLDSDGTCNLTQASDKPANANANLGPLQDNGGLTETQALLPGSDALDMGDNTTCAAAPVDGVDQRGVSRPQPAAGTCDIGAYEALQFELEIQTSGSGVGRVASTPSGIDCGHGETDCVAAFVDGQVVTLSVGPGAFSHFVGWDPASDPDCLDNMVTMDADTLCIAVFDRNPTAVGTTRFGAESDATGGVQVTWETASEAGVLGFNVYRDRADGEGSERVNARLIPGLGSSAEGARYRLSDRPGPGTHHYTLEVIHGQEPPQEFGPVTVRVDAPRLFLPLLLRP